jgi:hypothetical protein
VFIHPSSVNHELQVQRFKHPYLVFLEHTKTSKVGGTDRQMHDDAVTHKAMLQSS